MKPLSLAIAALASVWVASLSGRAQTPAPAPPSPPGFVFAGLVGGANPAPQTITVTTGGPGSPLQVTSSQPSWLAVTVTNQGTQASVTASVNLTGLPPGVRQAIIDLASNTQLIRLIVWLTTVQAPPADSAYLVDLKYTGYTGLAEGYPDCAVNPRGFDMLSGIVTGREAVAQGDDVEYRGNLKRVTVIDICESRGRRRPDDDERVWCAAKLDGNATMEVQLVVYGDQDRGAFLKAKPDPKQPFKGEVTGDCDKADMLTWKSEYPDGGSGGSPDGQPIDEAPAPPQLFDINAGRPRLVVGDFPPRNRVSARTGQLDGWTLRVIKKLK